MTSATPLGAFEHLDPRTLELRDNVRMDAKLSKAFVANIAEHGVLVPITAVRTKDGAVRVRTGQRRVLAAREAGLSAVPVYISGDGYDETDPVQRSTRVIDQIVENEQRAELSDVEVVMGMAQLFDDNLSVTKVAKALSLPAKTVKAAKAVSQSQAAIDKLADGQLTLGQAAVIAEFDGDDDAVARLLDCATGWRAAHFDQEASRLRELRAYAAAEQAAANGYTELGFTVLDERPESFDPRCVPLYSLLDANGAEASTDAAKNPAEWAVVLVEDFTYVDVKTGDLVDEADVDWDTQGRPDATPRTVSGPDGEEVTLRHADTVKEVTGFTAEYYCIDYTAAGLTPTERFVNLAGKHRVAEVENADLTPEQIEAKRVTEAEAKATAESRERRKVLALNRLGQAAENVRREFVKTLLSRKTPPKGAAVFVAQTQLNDPYLLTTNGASAVTAELLGVEHITGYSARGVDKGANKLLAGANDNRAQVITLALVLGALEARTPKDAWRGQSLHSGQKDYLGFLAANGYVLADIEEVVTGKRKADKVFDAL